MDNMQIMKTGDGLSRITLLIEGAITVYETDAASLVPLAQAQNQFDAVSAFNLIGYALYEIRTTVRQLRQSHEKTYSGYDDPPTES